MIKILMFILVAHMFGDYFLQTDYMACNKGKDNYILLVHAVLYNFGIMVVAFIFGITGITIYFYLCNIILHFGIDYLKARGITAKMMGDRDALIVDQIAHYFILIVAVFINYHV